MAHQVIMPKQGNTVESCILLEWKKAEGDTVKLGEVLCEAETDKAVIEVESTASGTLLKLLCAENDEVPVLSPIAVIGEPGEDISSLESADAAGKPADAQPQELREEIHRKPPGDVPMQTRSGLKGVSPRARNLAKKLSLDPSEVSGSGPEGRVIERDIFTKAASHQPLTPAARELHAREGGSLPRHGSGIGRRIRSADIAESKAEYRDIPLSRIRAVTARRMLESIQQSCQLTLTSSADASAMLSLRKRCKEEDGTRDITLHVMVLFVLSRTLGEFPYINAHFLGDRTREFAHCNIGFAVDTPRGLMVPVVRNAQDLTISELAGEVKRLSRTCIDGKAGTEVFEGGTCTVTNLGAYGIEHFTPVLNPPQVAILGVNAITITPVSDAQGRIILQPRMGFSLTMDHQAVDGAPAAKFLQAFTQAVESVDQTAGI